MEGEKLYTVDQAAERLQVTPATVREWLKAERLKGHKIAGRLWRIREKDLNEFMEGDGE